MKHISFIALISIIALLFTGCGTPVKYLGSTNLPETEKVDIYFSEKDVERPFITLGHAEINCTGSISSCQKVFEKDARKKGADGIIYEDLKTVPSQSYLVDDSFIKAIYIKYK